MLLDRLNRIISALCRLLSPLLSHLRPNPVNAAMSAAAATTDADGITHRSISANGITLHIAENGTGAPILFIHGFPELWYSWRHQILALSSLGYRAIAPDMRGYGGTDAPREAREYTYCHVVGDLIAVLDELGVEEKVFVVGHDWGAAVAWWLCLFRPDRVKALVNLSVAFTARKKGRRPVEALRGAYGDEYYMCRFQVPGEIEAEIEEAGGANQVLRKFFAYRHPGPLYLPKGALKETIPLPEWLTEQDFAYYCKEFERTGFAGGLNYYRVLNLNWEITAPWTGAQVQVPVKFIVGDVDLTYAMPGVKDYIHKGGMKKDVPFLQEVVILEGVGHFLQQEKPDEISKHIYDFFKTF
ncbi:Epoxide hydrolase A-like protein [Drosera capensis]